MASHDTSPRSLITLTTDFGISSPYVAQLKGAIYTINPAAVVIDASHSVPPQDIHAGACVLDEIHDAFPPGTIHVAVVDPGVGTERRMVCAELDGQYYVMPDNGLITFLAARYPPASMVHLTEARYWRTLVSATFHGRDIMGPVAAHLSLGVSPAELGKPVADWQRLPWPPVQMDARRVIGHIRSIDGFGNLLSDILLATLPAAPQRIECCGQVLSGVARCYGDVARGTLLALVSSNGYLEIALSGGNAAEQLGARIGSTVHVEHSRPAFP